MSPKAEVSPKAEPLQRQSPRQRRVPPPRRQWNREVKSSQRAAPVRLHPIPSARPGARGTRGDASATLRQEEMARGHCEEEQSPGDSRQREELAMGPCSALQPGHLGCGSRAWTQHPGQNRSCTGPGPGRSWTSNPEARGLDMDPDLLDDGRQRSCWNPRGCKPEDLWVLQSNGMEGRGI